MNRLIKHFASQGSTLGFFAVLHHSLYSLREQEYLVKKTDCFGDLGFYYRFIMYFGEIKSQKVLHIPRTEDIIVL
jgi:hypothetical protein